MSSVKIGESRYRQVAFVCSILVLAIGGFALGGWITGNLALAGMLYDWVPMAPSTSLLFILFASAIILTSFFDESRHAAQVASITVSACGAIAVFFTSVSLMGIHSSLEHPGLKVTEIPGLPPKGHISPVTAACFVVAAAAFLLTRLSGTRGKSFSSASRWTSSLLMAANFTFFLAYLFGIPYLYGGSFIPPAAPTLTAFVLLGAALFADATASSPIFLMNGSARNSTRLLFIVFLAVALGILTAGNLYYRQFQQRQRLEAERQLSAIADLKMSELVNWRKERLGDGEVLRGNPAFTGLIKRYVTDGGDRGAERELKGWLARIKSSYDYDRLAIVDNRCNLRLSVPANKEPLHTCTLDFATRVVRDGKTAIADFHRDSDRGSVHLSVVVPITDDGDSGAVLGVVIFYIDPARNLYPFIQKWPVPSGSGETLLVRREGNSALFLNRLRFDNSEPLTLRKPLSNHRLPAARAVLGDEGTMEGADYRNISVVAALRHVPDSPWFLVSKMDTTEVYAPVRERLWMVISLMGMLLVSAAAGVGLIWRQQSAAYYKGKLRVELDKRASEAKLEAALESMPDAVFITDTEGRFLEFNKAFVTYYKFRSRGECPMTLGEFSALLDVHMDNGESAPPEKWPAFRALRGETARNAEYCLRRKDTGETWIGRYSFAPIRDEKGAIAGSVVVGRDITDQKKAEAALRESEERYRHLFENMLEGFSYCRMDFDGETPLDFTFIMVNPAFEKLTGFKNVEGKRVTEVIPGIREKDPQLFKIYGRVALSGIPESFEIHVESMKMWFSISVYCPKKEHFVTVFDDITSRKKAEAALLESERRLRRAEEIALLGHWRINAETNQVAWSDEIYRLLGVSREAYQPTLDWYEDFVHPDDRENLPRFREALMADGHGSFEARIIRLDGGIRHMSGLGEIQKNPDGRVTAIFGTFQDVTDLRLKERELQDRNIELERLNYTVSHDLKSPLVTIKTFLGYLAMDMKKGDPARIEQDMMYMRTSSERMGLLLEDLFNLTRVGRVFSPPVDVPFPEVAREAVNLVAGRISQRGVKIKIGDFPLVLHGDRPRLIQLWQNLIDNAVKFMGEQKEPLIEIGVRPDGRNENVFFVVDNGQGIDPRHKDKIFGLFEQLDPRMEGTGIGLALVKRIVDLYGGSLWVESEGNGMGASFNFTLPGAIIKI
jgi:PAS domain S-box-containing protein